jgi:hypothetical protein
MKKRVRRLLFRTFVRIDFYVTNPFFEHPIYEYRIAGNYSRKFNQ